MQKIYDQVAGRDPGRHGPAGREADAAGAGLTPRRGTPVRAGWALRRGGTPWRHGTSTRSTRSARGCSAGRCPATSCEKVLNDRAARGLAAQGDHLGRGQGPRRPGRRRGRAGDLRASAGVSPESLEVSRLADGLPREDALAFFDAAPPSRSRRCSAGGGGAGCPPARRWTGCSRPTAGTARSSSTPRRCTRCCSRDRRGRPAAGRPGAAADRGPARPRRPGAAPGRLRTAFRLAPAAADDDEAPKARLRDGRAPRACRPRRWSTTRCRSSTSSGGCPTTSVLGLMDLRGLPDPFFFVLRRER